MRSDQIKQLQEAVIAARQGPGFIEWIDDDESQQVVTDIVKRETEAAPVAILSGGGYVVLTVADACDFRLVTPAIPPDPMTLGCKVKVPDHLSILDNLPDAKITIQVTTLPPDDPTVTRCAEQCQPPAGGVDFGPCPKCGRLVAYIFRDGERKLYPAEGVLVEKPDDKDDPADADATDTHPTGDDAGRDADSFKHLPSTPRA